MQRGTGVLQLFFLLCPGPLPPFPPGGRAETLEARKSLVLSSTASLITLPHTPLGHALERCSIIVTRQKEHSPNT
ncbi:hypothetical protein QBC36DRAFT_336850 [Triangularia setosa]|uniref:Uncharacterized protein n=1 Tax=Triangularia setosa TaxID=2587417 RepID=A0AAN6W288_9PEZI|nr:hypothetical protein QBC36DRAFT_336850 [Podospora setosa]